MTSKDETQKTSEFLHRRKLRLQQVREQSKDIAKKIRQRAKVEKLRQVVELDQKKERDFIQSQEKVVKKLEELYSRGLDNVGNSHQQARGLTQRDTIVEKNDLSHLRGREAAAELRKQKQQKFNEIKRALDRKVQAREAANILSREKSVTAANKLPSKHSSAKLDEALKSTSENVTDDHDISNKELPKGVSCSDMATQWDMDILQPEWEPNIPTLNLPKDDCVKETDNEKNTDKPKRPDLFAVSEEMPSSLRGGTHKPCEAGPSRLSSTLVSEYIQNRALRLRESEASISIKKHSEDLKNLRQTIIRSRPLQSEGNFNNESLQKGQSSENVAPKKKSITMYNHSTRDSRAGRQAAARCEREAAPAAGAPDAYSRALSEATSAADCATHKHKHDHELTNRVAVKRQNVEKEYKDTITFLNSLPRSTTNKSINNAFKDESRLRAQKDSRQRILQQEFKNIELESRRQGSTSRLPERNHNKRCRLPTGNDEDHFRDRDFQYSWMPVPERDSHLAVHTIPAAGGVKFSDVDSYHEYRSRHKHTPPTKDTSQRQENRRVLETVILQNDDGSLSGSSASETSIDSRELAPERAQDTNNQPEKVLKDMERIIIYKILNHKHRKKNSSVKGDKRISNTKDEEIPESSSKGTTNDAGSINNAGSLVQNKSDPLSCESFNEGIYKVRSNTEENLESMYCAKLDESQRKANDNKTDNSDKSKQDTASRNIAEGDIQQPRKKCTSKCKSRDPGSRPAAETSIRPSPSDNITTELTSREAGFVKLIDDGQKKEGNFYIGATGFLRDDAYEVIIQLRKKETGKTDEVKEVEPEIKLDAANDKLAHTKEVITESLPSQDHVQEEAITVSEHSRVHTAPHIDTSAGNLSPDNQCAEPHCPSSFENDDQTTAKIMHDRSVSPINKDLYIFSEPTAKSNPIPRPATSTYTQTTLSSPNPRPTYIHMSSSTSTAYMSPPDVVLPNFLRRGHKRCRKELHSARNIEKYEKQKNKHQESHGKKYCSCKISNKILPELSSTDQLLQSSVGFTAADIKHTCKNMSEGKTDNALSSTDMHQCLQSRHRPSSKPCQCCKQHLIKTKPVNTVKDSKSIWNVKNSIVRNKKSRTYTPSSKSYLNPIIKEYIHKLLSLNREGIKTIQIVNQDCSSVNTPGSSIINVPSNRNIITSQRGDLDLSMEQIKHVLKQRTFLTDNFSKCRPDEIIETETVVPRNTKLRKRNPKKKKLHKIKSLNISKKINKKPCGASSTTHASSGSNTLSGNQRVQNAPASESSNSHSEVTNRSRSNSIKADSNKALPTFKDPYIGDDSSSSQPKPPVSSDSTSSNNNQTNVRRKCMAQRPINTSTQTNRTIDEEMNFIKLAEGKLQNMEKIADLTEKCSKRLSNLAKVLEEVRKNKSLAYSQISTPDSTSDSDQRSERNVAPDIELKVLPAVSLEQISENVDSTDYESLISGDLKSAAVSSDNKHSDNKLSYNTDTDLASKPSTTTNTHNTKCRTKPPPALLRMHLKSHQENVVPHELSTVIEVDSPSSVKFKSQSSATNISQSTKRVLDTKKDENVAETHYVSPELIMGIANNSSNDKMKLSAVDSSDNSKLQMMDLNQFNEIMLRPFITLQEYAQDFYEVNLDTKCESIPKDIGFTDDVSSLHSDGSLPDVVAELLKRKIITEPFRFDTASNVHSTTVSSASSLSALALSKTYKDKSKSKLSANKENVEVSDSLSISSNPDLENAFKKLGMGWASSTLKKTKERLALSSSSNTSSSSLSQIKFKNSCKQDVLVSDSISTVPNVSRKTVVRRQLDASRNAEQQTSFTNSMTVKEFLTKELARKITFTEKSDRNDTNLEFVSLFETKLPDGLKNSSHTLLENESGESAPSANNNRARTSTPVNVLKSVTQHSSSSSNMSNGLFSNADDLSSVKLTSTSVRYHSTSEKDELTIPNCSLKMRKALSESSKTDSC